jgi:phosphoserine phosphatase RsbU/P
MICFFIGIAGGRPVRLPIEPGDRTLGRGSSSDLCLDDPSVSRRHAMLRRTGDEIRLRDTDSSNGTWHNGARVADWVRLRPGDRVRFGKVDVILWAGESAADAPLALPPATPLPAAHDTITFSLSEPGEVLTGARLDLASAQGEFAAATVDQKLFRAVTEAGRLLVVPRPVTETFQLVLKLVEAVIPARRILLLLTDTPDGSPTVRAARPEGETAAEKLVLSRTLVATVLRDRESLLLNDLCRDPRFVDQQSIIRQSVCSALVAPLFDNTRVIGLLYADTADPRVHYDRDQLRAFTLLANLIAVQITTARLLEAEREQERMAQEVAAASEVQRNLLPAQLPQVDGYEFAARQIPCCEVAGDLYDAIALPDGRVAVAVGDVTGKGLGAALLMAGTIAGLRILLQERPRLEECAERLHRQILQASEATRFVTLFLGLLDPASGRLEYVNAGHNPPWLLAPDGEPVTLDATGLPLGLIQGATYAAASIVLPPGGVLCVYSDGISEAGRGDELYGEERLLASVRRHLAEPACGQLEGILNDLRTFLAGACADDDMTLLLVRRHDAAAAPQPAPPPAPPPPHRD